MRPMKLICSALAIVLTAGTIAALSLPATGQAPRPSAATLFEGARLIVGDGSVPIENSAFLVENGRFTRVGRRGEVQASAGASRVDLSGKTVMPAIVDDHAHLGYVNLRSPGAPESYTRENLVDQLQRYAYYGVAASMSMGTDRGDLPYQVRENPIPGAALLRTAGRGIATPNGGPTAPSRIDVPYGVTNEAEARKAVQDLAARKVDLVKIWVDDRNKTVKKLPPALYRAIIDEAHKQNLRVVAHIFELADAKDLLRSGIDGFAHGVRDRDIDDEFVALFNERPNVFLIPNLPDRGVAEDPAWLSGTVPPEEIKQMRDAAADRKPDDVKRAQELFGIQARNLAKLNAAGVRIAFGTDGNGAGWQAHVEMTDMVAAGMTPAQVIVSATRNAAEILRLNQLGTVAAGKSADFIVLDANPLDDITNTRRIARVYLRGAEVDRAGLRKTLTGRPTE